MHDGRPNLAIVPAIGSPVLPRHWDRFELDPRSAKPPVRGGQWISEDLRLSLSPFGNRQRIGPQSLYRDPSFIGKGNETSACRFRNGLLPINGIKLTQYLAEVKIHCASRDP